MSSRLSSWLRKILPVRQASPNCVEPRSTSQQKRGLLLAIALLILLPTPGFSLYVHLYVGVDPPNYSKIEKGLYMGGHVPQPPPGTRAVLNLCELADDYEVEVQRHAPIRDSREPPTLDWLRDQVNFIHQQRQAGLTTYVHCFAGVSRAGMMMTAYQMHKNGWTRDKALEFVRSKRPIVRPNPTFMDLLLEWEKELRKQGTIH